MVQYNAFTTFLSDTFIVTSSPRSIFFHSSPPNTVTHIMYRKLFAFCKLQAMEQTQMLTRLPTHIFRSCKFQMQEKNSSKSDYFSWGKGDKITGRSPVEGEKFCPTLGFVLLSFLWGTIQMNNVKQWKWPANFRLKVIVYLILSDHEKCNGHLSLPPICSYKLKMKMERTC